MATYDYITGTGVIVADTSEIRDQVASEFKAVFGDDLVTDSGTVQGVMIDIETEARTRALNSAAIIANQINPNQATGVFLEAVMALTADSIHAATHSIATVTFRGAIGATIPENTTVLSSNDRWLTSSQVIISSDSTVNVEVIAEQPGPVFAAAGEINRLGSGAPLGVSSVTNEFASNVGKNKQSDSEARSSRRLRLGKQGISLSQNVMSNIASVEGVSSVAFRENTDTTQQTIDGILLKPNSTWVCVDGGLEQDIADAYWRSKSGGAGFNGSVSVHVSDKFSGQIVNVLFDRPAPIQIIMKITVVRSSLSNPTDEIRAAILDYASGKFEGDYGFVVGADVSPYEISASIVNRVQGVFISKLEVAKVSETLDTNTIPIAINEVARILSGDIQIVYI